jgi:regulator of replication initiation timing
MEDKQSQNDIQPSMIPPHAKSLFYKTLGERNLLVSDLQKIFNSNSLVDSRESEMIESLVYDISVLEGKIHTIQKLFPELLEEEENLRQFSLQRRLQAVKQAENQNKQQQEMKKTKAVKPSDIKGDSTPLYEDGKVVSKFK